jgi:fructoselysine-6-P-deglycase FrlB-like protein
MPCSFKAEESDSFPVNSGQPTLAVVADQVARQPEVLSSCLNEAQLEAPPGSLFVGAGDSFASSSIASHLSSMKCQALDPYELISNPDVAAGRTTYFVTVSGNTASSVSAARAAGKVARKRVAMTANEKGKITDVVDEVILIPCGYVPRLPGTLSFSLSLLLLLKSVSGRFECDFTGVDSRARRDARKLLFSEEGATYFLGNNAAFPIGQYSALKIYEFLGMRAQAERLEEFSHAPIFSLRKEDVVNIFCAFDPLHIGQKLATSLRKRGFSAKAILPFGSNLYEQAFYLVFLAQLAVLQRAKSEGRSRPYFLGSKDKLAVSDSMIY